MGKGGGPRDDMGGKLNSPLLAGNQMEEGAQAKGCWQPRQAGEGGGREPPQSWQEGLCSLLP